MSPVPSFLPCPYIQFCGKKKDGASGILAVVCRDAGMAKKDQAWIGCFSCHSSGVDVGVPLPRAIYVGNSEAVAVALLEHQLDSQRGSLNCPRPLCFTVDHSTTPAALVKPSEHVYKQWQPSALSVVCGKHSHYTLLFYPVL